MSAVLWAFYDAECSNAKDTRTATLGRESSTLSVFPVLPMLPFDVEGPMVNLVSQ